MNKKKLKNIFFNYHVPLINPKNGQEELITQ